MTIRDLAPHRRHLLLSWVLFIAVLTGCDSTPPTAVQSTPPTAALGCEDINPDTIHQFIDGIDECLREMDPSEIQAELGDLWWRLVLSQMDGSEWPRTVSEVDTALMNAGLQRESYVVGEGSQVPESVADIDANRNLRYIVGFKGENGRFSVLVNALPEHVVGNTPPPFLEIIAWNDSKQRFNYYQHVNNEDVLDSQSPVEAGPKTWSWAGDSEHSRLASTTGRGCFRCHRNGNLIMKELVDPWNNWHSPRQTISIVPTDVAMEKLFSEKKTADELESGLNTAADVLTTSFISNNVDETTQSVSNIPALLSRVIQTTTVNLVSALQTSLGPTDVNIPTEFFVNDNFFRDPQFNFGYFPDVFSLDKTKYRQFVEDHEFKLVHEPVENNPGYYEQSGSTVFAFLVPAPAREDLSAIKEIVSQNIISKQFAACIQMVDYPNPVFSNPRESLMQYANQIDTGVADGQDIPKQFAALIAAANPSPGSPEDEFLNCWNNANWESDSQTTIQTYLNNVASMIEEQNGLSDYMTLAVSRRHQLKTHPRYGQIAEFSLLFPQTNLGDLDKQMNPDGSIGDRVD